LIIGHKGEWWVCNSCDEPMWKLKQDVSTYHMITAEYFDPEHGLNNGDVIECPSCHEMPSDNQTLQFKEVN